jgi:alpha-tubulin suppressor-like RCC1 family protein
MQSKKTDRTTVNNNSSFFFRVLPPELFINIGQEVNYQDFSSFMQTCKFFYKSPVIREIRAAKTAGWLAAGENYSIMHLSNNNLLVVGDNKSGQLGLGDYKYHSKATRFKLENIPEGIIIKRVITGARHSFIHLSNDTIFVCGNNQSGQLGLGHSKNMNTFSALPLNNILKEGLAIREIVAGEHHTLLHLSNDELWVCGDNEFGQLGLGTVRNATRFTQLVLNDIPKGVGISKVIAGANHTILHLSNDTLLLAGDNRGGQLGLGHKNEQKRFTTLQLDIPVGVRIRQIVAGTWHTFILLSNNECLVCGGNTSGQLGLGHSDGQNRFTKLTLDLPKNVSITQLVAGASHNVILLSNNELLLCGYNKMGQLGLGNNDNQNVFKKLTLKDIPPMVTIREVVAATHQTMVYLSNNDVLVCGDNKYNQLGINHKNPQNTFISSNSFSQVFCPDTEPGSALTI